MDEEELDLSEERRQELITRKAFENAVSRATREATQNVARVHRIRLVVMSSLCTAFIMAFVGAVVIGITSQSNAEEAKQNSTFNCDLFTNIASLQKQFVETDANLLEGQRFNERRIARLHPGALKSLFADPQTVALNKQSSVAEKDTIHFWERYLIPNFENLANVNCTTRIH